MGQNGLSSKKYEVYELEKIFEKIPDKEYIHLQICEFIEEKSKEICNNVLITTKEKYNLVDNFDSLEIGTPFMYNTESENIINSGKYEVIDNSDHKSVERFNKKFEKYGSKDNIYSYIWIGMTKDNFPIVVGATRGSTSEKTHFGDFFKNYKIGISKTSEKILEYNNIKINKFIEYEKMINSLTSFGIIIPINLSGKSLTVDKRTTLYLINRTETEIGDLILSKEIPILNQFSHRKAYNH